MKSKIGKGKFFQSVKGKILIMGALGIAAALIESQKEGIDSTSNKFVNVTEGIDYTKDAVIDVLGQAKSCDEHGEAIVDLMTNLSAISEENAASAETTASSMSELGRETARLAETSAELKKFADTLKEDLEFFT